MNRSGKAFQMLRPAGVLLLLLCSCATPPEQSVITPASELPSPVTLTNDGRTWLIVMAHLEGDEEMPFIVDTGSTWTLLDKSLEPKLGKHLGTMTVSIFDGKKDLNRYAAPKLYLEKTPLVTGPHIYTTDHLAEASARSNRRIMGLIGMDCLKHYCLQIDSVGGQIRFLNPTPTNVARLGTAYPIAFKYLPFIHQPGLVEPGATNWFLLDTGCDIDGLLSAPSAPPEVWKNSDGSISADQPTGQTNNHTSVWFPKSVWNGNTYSNILIGTGSGMDLIGLRFLTRHLVTFDFPNRTLYLKQPNMAPTVGDHWVAEISEALRGAKDLMEDLKTKDQLPGWSRTTANQPLYVSRPRGDSNCYTLVYQEDMDASLRHYQMVRPSKDGSWRLQRAWRTNPALHLFEEYSMESNTSL